MNKELYIKVKELFEKVSEVPESEKESFVDKHSYGDNELKKEVLSLIDSSRHTKDFLEQPLTIDKQNSESFTDPYIGKQIGSYLIEGEAGIGGMGVVYKGARNDKEFDQQVAIKILKHGITSDYLLKRFQIERQALANLQHEFIARLLDGGRTEEGLPYLVMEFIHGLPITEFCRTKELNITERLELFKKVCGAVQYAHQNLIVHRDIKPGNILVTDSGVPKLLDFGIAKLLDEDVNDHEGLTRTGMWHLTPEYASPEQIKGTKITTASDIYSLGVLLYEILTGEQPYRITNSSPAAISKVITEENVLKPSEKVRRTTQSFKDEKSRINFEKISNQLKGDLDNIVLKAMHKDPEQRYASVKDFNDDISRYLKGLPVQARKDSITYRTSKFIARHKVGFSVFVIGNIFIIASIAAIIYQGNIAARERDRAQIELSKFEEVNNFLLEMLSSVDPGVESKDVKVYDLLEKATKDVDVNLKEYPEIQSAIKQTLGSTFIGLGDYEKAKKLLHESLESNKKLFGVISKESAKSSHQLGLCYDWIGDYKASDSFYNAGINIYEKVSDVPMKELADNLNDYGTFLSNLGDYDSAGVVYKRALDIYKLHGIGEGKKAAITINNMAVNLHHQKKIEEAEKFYRQAREILIDLYGPNKPEIASISNNLAFIYLDKKDYLSSEKSFIDAYNVKVATLGENHPSVGLAYVNLGMLYISMKDYPKSEAPLIQAVDLFKRINAPKDPILSLAYYWLGFSYLESNQLNKAEAELLKSLRIREEIFPENNFRTWSTKGELGVCYLKQKRYTEAEKNLLPSLDYFLNGKNKDQKKVTRYTEYSSLLYKELGNETKAKYFQTELQKLNEEIAVQ
ncbi:MAG: serine/threonine protein kinase [Ignavibacteriales bacterium]|nr:MAG: serine/threonine protein kinase [Ignavibacteriales bacterium]